MEQPSELLTLCWQATEVVCHRHNIIIGLGQTDQTAEERRGEREEEAVWPLSHVPPPASLSASHHSMGCGIGGGGTIDRTSRNLDGKSEKIPLCSAETLKFGSCESDCSGGCGIAIEQGGGGERG